MVDSIGWKALAPVARATGATAASAPLRAAAEVPVVEAAVPSGVARRLAAAAPVDFERVAQIKKAIADGKFPILPSTIADRLLALKLEWNPNDQA